MLDDEDTLGTAGAPTVAASPATDDTVQSPPRDHAPVDLAPAGYQLGALLGRGGMGEVIVAQDQRVGREVAYKRMRDHDASPESLSRFLREARIQARLDHPAIVPVYELGKDGDGRPYFTMKRLAGKTLAERLQDSSASLQPLLRAFAEVCQAIDLAHSKGVVHRDLKPSNIMLGDFGEVYVLDWGIARLLGERTRRPTGADPGGELDSIGEQTSGGTLLGTLGYMAPEQVRGEHVDGQADVYSLGAILFELLAGEPLHPRGHAAVASTLSMVTASPVERGTERAIAPELDALCSEMLTFTAEKRPTARQVAQRVQKYLDGDRDHEARRALGMTFLETAREALASGDPLRRADALRAAGRALALDPHSREAADLVTGMIVEPPKVLPPEVVDKIEENERNLARGRARLAINGYVQLLSLTVLLAFFKIASWPWLVALYAGIGLLIAVTWRTWRTGQIRLAPLLLGTVIVALLFSRVASPFVIVPSLLCATMIAVSNIGWLNDRPLVLYGWMAVAASLPLVLEQLGVISTTTFVSADAIELRSAILAPSGSVALPALAVANVVLLVFVARFAVLVARDRRAAQRRLTVQAWHLGQLLPETPQVVAAPYATRH